MTNHLIDHLQQLMSLSQSFQSFLTKNLTPLEIARGEFLLQPFQVCERLTFVGQGRMHAYRKVNGRRITCRFFVPGDLCIDPTGYFSGKPSSVYIAPVAGDCILYELNTTAKAAASQFADWPPLWEKLICSLLLADEDMLLMFRTMSARQRYEWAHRSYPGMEDAVRMRQFASWIGLHPVTVYEIEKQDKKLALRKGQKGS